MSCVLSRCSSPSTKKGKGRIFTLYTSKSSPYLDRYTVTDAKLPTLTPPLP